MDPTDGTENSETRSFTLKYDSDSGKYFWSVYCCSYHDDVIIADSTRFLKSIYYSTKKEALEHRRHGTIKII